jgi:hypothetical protein
MPARAYSTSSCLSRARMSSAVIICERGRRPSQSIPHWRAFCLALPALPHRLEAGRAAIVRHTRVALDLTTLGIRRLRSGSGCGLRLPTPGRNVIPLTTIIGHGITSFHSHVTRGKGHGIDGYTDTPRGTGGRDHLRHNLARSRLDARLVERLGTEIPRTGRQRTDGGLLG